ncbi:MAG TPA: DUF6624 domain-containing protein [Rhodanobacter sp.]
MWKVLCGAVVLSMIVNGVARAEDPFDVQLARQCPGMSAWVKVQEAKAAANKKVANQAKPSQPALRDELLKMSNADQQARNAAIADNGKHPTISAAVYAVDGRNLPRLKQIDATQGFPTTAQVGKDGVDAAWLLVQHADRDPTFQAHVLDELRPRFSTGDISVQDFSMLTDRVLTAQKKPQRYGSQFETVNGRMQPKPMEMPAEVDQRRAAIGLPPMADYACMLGMMYHTPVKS